MKKESAKDADDKDICRICHCEASPDLPLISPCWCSGSLRFIHQQCLQQWIKSSDARQCELCGYRFVMRTTVKPFSKWENLELSAEERPKVLCSVAFYAVAFPCGLWLLCWLLLKLILETIETKNFTSGLVLGVSISALCMAFLYARCDMPEQLFRRWRDCNTIVEVQNAPEKRPLQAMFAPAAQLTTQLTNEEKRTFPDEDEFHRCERDGSSSNSISSGRVEGQCLCELRPHTPTTGAAAAEPGSTKTTLTSVTDASVPGGECVDHQQHHQHHQHHPLLVVVVPSGGEDRQQATR